MSQVFAVETPFYVTMLTNMDPQGAMLDADAVGYVEHCRLTDFQTDQGISTEVDCIVRWDDRRSPAMEVIPSSQLFRFDEEDLDEEEEQPHNQTGFDTGYNEESPQA